ncbi:hypothetical protein XENOCAPTIV_013020, partial [Xenoophorus captivus]
LCIEFLERRLVQQLNSSVERAGEEVLHAFVLVHTKLLAFYSSVLTTSDLLALIVMAQNMYPSNLDLDDTSPEKDGLYPMMPHSMYCLSLWPGITLVLLTKIPTSAVAMSVYKYLEDFDKLEKRLHEGHGGPASARSPLNIYDIRTKMDKFIKALGPNRLSCNRNRSAVVI